ncbi:c-type cytochrome [Paraburkholderia oxyphila]|uniref:c-type cytochrome n=1 Tax=Paraburkholderia oxyphila TaxID=614212 RepID=UPI000486E091|nr:c-type cytochrome [Paraburkholderia oxyphila]
MKKVVLVAISAVFALLLALLGPDFLGIYRLQSYVTASAEANQAGGGAWPRLADACLSCHGVKGNSLNQGYPSLAGQPASYLAAQLHDFASEQRANPTMSPLAMTLSDSEIQSLSRYYSTQTAVANNYFQPDPRLRARGELLVARGSCVACHGARLMGHDQFPRLAGQSYDYILKQFDAFATGARKEPSGTMQTIAKALSPEDRKAIANYLADLNRDKK